MKPAKDQIILVTGSTDGIGRLTALMLAEKKAAVLVHGRNKEKTERVVKEIKEHSGNQNITGFTADFSSLEEVSHFAEEVLKRYPVIDVLINNAGVGYADKGKSREGYELRFAVNYLAPFLLTRLLLPALKAAAPSRIINVSSVAQAKLDFDDIMFEKDFEPVKAYSKSKLAQVMFTMDLAGELKDQNITVNALHPGTYLNTNMVTKAGIKPWGEAETGADAEIFLALSETLQGVTGKFFDVKKESTAHPQAYDETARKKLKDITKKLLNAFKY